MLYESANDINQRLTGSVVRYKGEPVLVGEVVGAKGHVSITHLYTDENERVLYTDLDLTPVPLGNTFVNGNVAFIQRKPARKWKQGLSNDNMNVKSFVPVRGLRNTSDAVIRTIKGEYPSIEDAFQKVRSGEYQGCPFSREWAVVMYDGDLSIVHRGEIVGYVTDKTIKLMPEKYYLQESLCQSLE